MIKRIFLAVLLAASSFAHADVLSEYVRGGMSFLEARLGYPPHKRTPQLVAVPKEQMPCKYCDAAYIPEVIFIKIDLLQDSLYAEATVIHELVHHYQHERGDAAYEGNCYAIIQGESEAERARLKFLEVNHRFDRPRIPFCRGVGER